MLDRPKAPLPPPPPLLVKAKPKRGREVRSARGSGAGSSAASNKAQTPMTHCDVCKQPGDNTNLVRCDECAKRYHFTCLEPPLNKNPKKRGYSWHCADCDPTDLEENT